VERTSELHSTAIEIAQFEHQRKIILRKKKQKNLLISNKYLTLMSAELQKERKEGKTENKY
jgi:hypothetical protein